MAFKVVVHDAEEGGFLGEVPALPGCCTLASSIEELRTQVLKAIEAHLGLVESPVIPEQANVFEIAV